MSKKEIVSFERQGTTSTQIPCWDKDSDSVEMHKKAVSDELDKSKPRDAVLLPLFKSFYNERRMFIQSEATCVKQIIEKYPALSRRAIVSHWALEYNKLLCDCHIDM